MANPRKGSNGYLIRVNAGTDLSGFTDITLHCSASSNQGFNLNLSASTLFRGLSTVYSSSEGLVFNSAEWVYGNQSSAWTTADDYKVWIVASGSNNAHFISPTFTITVDA